MSKNKYPYDANYILYVSMNLVGCKNEEEYSPSEEYTREKWESLTDDQKEDSLYEAAVTTFEGIVEYGYEVEDDEGENND